MLKRRHFNALLTLTAFTGSIGSAWSQQGKPRTVLVVGDSLTAEYGLKRGSGWVQILQKRLDDKKLPARLINAGISGDTTSGGRSRLPALLMAHQPDVVILELGGNDALRGLPLNMTKDNLSAMAKASKAAGAAVVIVGMQMPPNYGSQYTRDFASLFQQVATAEKASLVPFLLKGVADLPDPTRLFQDDRIHPNESAQPQMADNVWPALLALLPKR